MNSIPLLQMVVQQTIGLSFVMEIAKGPKAADEKTLND